MPVWTFYDYVEPSGQVPYFNWSQGLPEDAQAFITARLLQMQGLTRWSEKWISKYRGTRAIFELRCTFMKVQYRPLGTYAPNHSFVLLGGGVEKDDTIAKEIIDAVVRRQETLDEYPSYIRRHRFY